MTATILGDRKYAITHLVNVWRGRLSPAAQEHLGTNDYDALVGSLESAINVVLSRRGDVQWATVSVSEDFANMRQDLPGLVVEALRALDQLLPPEPGGPAPHAQSEAADIAAVIYRALDEIADLRARLEDAKQGGGK